MPVLSFPVKLFLNKGDDHEGIVFFTDTLHFVQNSKADKANHTYQNCEEKQQYKNKIA